MQACKKGCRYTAFTHLVLALVFSAVCALSLAAQNASAAAQSIMPVTAPQTPVPPSVTPPVIEGTSVPQLTPSADMHKVPARPETPRAPQPSAASQKMSIPQNPASPQMPQKPSGTAAAGTLQTSTPNDARSTAKTAAGNLTGKGAGSSLRNASLSAADISTLSSLLGSGNLFSAQGLGGLLSIPGTISGTSGNPGGGALAGILSGQPNAADLYGQNQTAILLQAVIEKLDALQKTVDLQNSAKGTTSGTDTKRAAKQDTQDTQDKQGGRILRFVAGNYNILPSCTAVFISQPEADGSFLLTGDRKYRSENSAAGKIYGETFYFLFKAAGGGTFNAAFSLSQQPENPDSPLYALTRASFLQAVRTGNLVTMRVLAENVQTDLLLDIDFNSREKGR
ncbi:MAG: hypothetical protein ACTTKC_06590 [Treponema sp.]|uniref:hypothetical protein n=1 Tax=Treponema sp. TaxID=166 RepID=UPI003FA2B079